MINCALSTRTKRFMLRSLLLGGFSSIAVLTGCVPNLSGQANPFSMTAHAQESPFTRYVRAAFEIEQSRQGFLEQMKQLTGGNVPSDVCRNVSQINPSVRDQAQGICDSFMRRAKEIVANYQLKDTEFNNFRRQSQEQGMQTQINNEARRLGLIR
jgi:hypothetical protein